MLFIFLLQNEEWSMESKYTNNLQISTARWAEAYSTWEKNEVK